MTAKFPLNSDVSGSEGSSDDSDVKNQVVAPINFMLSKFSKNLKVY